MLQRQLSKEGLQNVIEDKDQVRDAASVSELQYRVDAVDVAVGESTRRDAVVRRRSIASRRTTSRSCFYFGLIRLLISMMNCSAPCARER